MTVVGSKFKAAVEHEAGDFNFKAVKKYDKRIHDFWTQAKSRYPITIERDKQYLNWRYFNHPLINYQIFAAEQDEEIKSLLVLRLEDSAGFRAARIIDLVALNGFDKFTILKTIEYCNFVKADFIDYYFSEHFHLGSLKTLGFYSCRRRPYAHLPKVFNPLKRTGSKRINFVFKMAKHSPEAILAANLNNWYMTKGGGDQDRSY